MNALLRLFGWGGARRAGHASVPLAAVAEGAPPAGTPPASAPPRPAPEPAPEPAPPPRAAAVAVTTTTRAEDDGRDHRVPATGEASRLPLRDLARVLRALGAHDPEGWAAALAPAMARRGIDREPRRIAAFLANVLHETGGLKRTTESLNYAADRLVAVFGAHRITHEQAWALGRKPGQPALPAERQAEIANLVYGGAWGLKNLGNTAPDDGWRFRGRGLLQLTGRSNYARFAKTIGVALEDLPALLETRDGAAESAAHFFDASGCCHLADLGDVAAVRKRINGGALGLAEVEAHYAHALKLLAAASGGANA